MRSRTRMIGAGVAVVVGLLALVWILLTPGEKSDTAGAPETAQVSKVALHEDSRTVSRAERLDAIARAQIWREPSVPIARAALGRDPSSPRELACRFKVADTGGTTPKFHCLLDSGREIRTKYGGGPEIPAEAATTRLLTALGFGADTVMLVERLRCYGCPPEPFLTMKVVEATGTQPIYERVRDGEKTYEFEWAAIEHKFDARPIESDELKGWAFFELDAVDASKGGAPRVHVDALRLMAVFLAHWDNKSENQRLVCLSPKWAEGTPCPKPYLLLQDVGATFGPSKVDLHAWERAVVWEDRPTCTLSMKTLPYAGGTFGTAHVSEPGRQFLVGLLGQLTDAQLADLFSGARFDQHRGPLKKASPVSEWVRVFRKRLKAISEGPACPAA